MKKELQEKLFKRFPRLFGQKDLPMSQTCMCWGIDTGDGWFDLIWKACERLEKVDPDLQFTQVKEKFGGLRMYAQTTTDEAWDIIDEIEAESYKICEDCGSNENVKTTDAGWIRSLCPTCLVSYKEGRDLCW